LKKFRVIVQFKYLVISEDILFSIFNVRLTSGYQKFRALTDEGYHRAIGMVQVDSFETHQAFGLGIHHEMVDDGYNSRMTAFTNDIIGKFSEFLDCLWLIKDHSVSIDIVTVDNSQKLFQNRAGKINSLSSGKIEQINFTIEEMEKARLLYEKLAPYISEKWKHIPEYNISLKSWTETAHINTLPYATKGIVERAFDFLAWARGEPYVPYKIALYMPIYESLFTTDSSEVTYKIAIRAAVYLGGTYSEKVAAYKLLKKAYAVRSAIFHGGTLTKKQGKSKSIPIPPNELSDLSIEVDNLTRKILTKVINEGLPLFLETKENLENHFLDLLLKEDSAENTAPLA
jgi:hypothetical protein